MPDKTAPAPKIQRSQATAPQVWPRDRPPTAATQKTAQTQQQNPQSHPAPSTYAEARCAYADPESKPYRSRRSDTGSAHSPSPPPRPSRYPAPYGTPDCSSSSPENPPTERQDSAVRLRPSLAPASSVLVSLPHCV